MTGNRYPGKVFDRRGVLKLNHEILERLALGVAFGGLAFGGGRVAEGEQAIDAVLARLGKDFPDLGGVEVPDPHVREAGVRGRKHEVRQDDGSIGLRCIHPVTGADPGFLVAAAYDKDHGRTITVVDRPELCKGLFAFHHPDAHRLTVRGGRGQAAGFQDHLQLGGGYGIVVERVAGITALQDVHEGIRPVGVLGDLLLHVGEIGAASQFRDVAEAAE